MAAEEARQQRRALEIENHRTGSSRPCRALRGTIALLQASEGGTGCAEERSAGFPAGFDAERTELIRIASPMRKAASALTPTQLFALWARRRPGYAPPMGGTTRGVDTEVVVVGAGVMGLATARVLARAGREVVICEQFSVGHDRGSSHGASRIVRLSYPDARWVRLAQSSYPLWRELEIESGSQLLQLTGTLDLGDWEANRLALEACGEPSEVLDAAEIGRRFPIRADGSGLYQRDGGIIRADLALGALRDGAIAAGARLQEGVRVESLDEDGEVVAAGGVRAKVAVVTAGAWAPGLVGVDATPTRETTSYFAGETPVPSVIDSTTGAVWGYALVAPGVGLKAGLHQSGPAVDPDDPGGPDEELATRTAEWVVRRFPGVSGPVHAETCLYTTRTDDEFLLERRGRVVVGSACSGHGFKFAPAIGAQLAALVEAAL